MSRLSLILTIAMLGCASSPDGDDDTQADSTSLADTETATETETGDDSACGPKPADYVCVEADSACEQLGASSCDPNQPWLDFFAAGCDIESAPNCDWGG